MAGGTGFRLDTLQTRRLLGGFTITSLAKAANVSDQTIKVLENGGNCTPDVAARILNALAPAVAVTSNTQANPTVLTTATNTFQTGDTVVLASIAGASADPNGSRVITRINGTSFSVPIDCSVSGGTGGTATAAGASIGQAAL